MPEADAQNQACLQNLPTELKKLVLQHLRGGAKEPDEYELGALTEYQIISHRLARTCQSWRRLILPALYEHLSLLREGGRSLRRLEALCSDTATLGSIFRIGFKVLRAAPASDLCDTPRVSTKILHAEEDYLLSTIIAQCSTVKVVECEADADGDSTLFHPIQVIHALSTLSSIVELRAFRVTTASHLLCLAQTLRSVRSLQTIFVGGSLPRHTTHAQGQHDFARNQLALALAQCQKLIVLGIVPYLLPAILPGDLGTGWKPKIARLLIQTSEARPVPSMSWLSELCAGTARELVLLNRASLAGVRALLSQNAPPKALCRLTLRSHDSQTPFQLKDLDELSSVSLTMLQVEGCGSAALAAHVLRTKACLSLRKVILRDDEPGEDEHISFRYIRDWAAGRQDTSITYNGKRLEDMEL